MPAKKPLKILMAASEGVPFSKTGGLADVIGALPQALAANGAQVTVVLPRYRGTRLENPKARIRSLTIPLGSTLHFPSILEAPATGSVRWLFVDYPEYFDRDSLYVGAGGTDYPDNPERFSLFSRAVIEIAKSVFTPDVIHCHDWQAGLVPVLMKSVYAADPALAGIPVAFTVHNLGYQGVFPADSLARTGLPPDWFRVDRLEFYGQVNFLKGALISSDAITTVSRKYAEEIQTPEYGFGLDGVLRDRAESIRGILNGADYAHWDPAVDGFIAANYNVADLDGKRECKRDLLREFGLPDHDLDQPLIGVVSRLTRQKGADLIAEIAQDLLRDSVHLVALGTGELEFEKLFLDLASRFPNRVAVRIAYDDKLAHKIEAGADMFLMPSRYEPCGLNQIYSLRYGTVPIVRATGGLDDTIEDYHGGIEGATGFKFAPYTGTALLDCVKRALTIYDDKAAWTRLMRNGMTRDFSWSASAREYVRLYREISGASGTESGAAVDTSAPVKAQTAKQRPRPGAARSRQSEPKPPKPGKKG